jgi:hypothetical protein
MLRLLSAAQAFMLAPFIIIYSMLRPIIGGLHSAVIAVLLLLALPLPVLAQAVEIAGDAVVTVPYGDWIASSLGFLGWLVPLVIMWALRQLPANIVAVIKTARVEQVLQRGIDYALNAVAGATKDKVLDAEVGNRVIAEALRYIVNLGPKWLIGFLGGEEGIKARIIARLELKPEVAVSAASQLITAAPAPKK